LCKEVGKLRRCTLPFQANKNQVFRDHVLFHVMRRQTCICKIILLIFLFYTWKIIVIHEDLMKENIRVNNLIKLCKQEAEVSVKKSPKLKQLSAWGTCNLVHLSISI
jgi:membrane associated rhomboid family serine protease